MNPIPERKGRFRSTAEDLPLDVRDYSQTPFNSIADGDVEPVRGLVATFENMPKSDWAEASWGFLVEWILR